ncbi:MAG: hypothetical protein AAB958_00085 [Patescibacteria group bacterium]
MTDNKNNTEKKILFNFGDKIHIILSDGNPNHKGGMHTNGPPDFWFKEPNSDDEWHLTFCSSDISMGDFQRLLEAGLNFTSLRSILFAGGRR